MFKKLLLRQPEDQIFIEDEYFYYFKLLGTHSDLNYLSIAYIREKFGELETILGTNDWLHSMFVHKFAKRWSQEFLAELKCSLRGYMDCRWWKTVLAIYLFS